VVTTKPTCQKNVTLFSLFVFETFCFAITQCSLLTLHSIFDLAWPGSTGYYWMCPWSDLITQIIALILLYVFIAVTYIAVLVIGNGHFLGQDYIIRPLAKKLGWNLDRLDPDGSGPEGGMVNIEILFAMVPTTVGYWSDNWNVAAYLIMERSKIYAEELRIPHRCAQCGEIHIPYINVIHAQAKSLSLAYQALPFGTVLGKLCEYSNNPPTWYSGKAMQCLGKTRHSMKKEFV
jgi:hypothetical protein